MKIIISMAGLGNRFKERGFKTPKHLIKIDDKTLIELAIESLNIEAEYIFIIRNENGIDNSYLKNILNNYKGSKIIEIDYVTDGPASSAYLSKNILEEEEELIITNCDQILEWDSNLFLKKTREKNLDCCLLTYLSDNPKNSFLKVDDYNKVISIEEKKVISNKALVGLHYFKKSIYFINAYEELYKNNIRTNNEFYMSNVCNLMINKYNVGYIELENNEKYHSTGTPDCYFKYLRYINKLNTKIFKIEDMFRGWFIGNFEPSVYKNCTFEVGYLYHKKNELWDTHYHNNIIEVNLLIEGKMILNDIEINKNEIFIIDRKEIACPIFLEDCRIICIKIPSILCDKIII